MSGVEVDDGLADFHMSIGVWTPFSTEGAAGGVVLPASDGYCKGFL